MLDDRVLALLAGKNFASLATSMPNGSPHVTNVWIDYDHEHNILINTAIGRLKERNIRKNKKLLFQSLTPKILMKLLRSWV